MKREKIKVTCTGYKYAPELCNIFVNGKLYAERGTQAAHDIAYLFITGHAKEAADTVKRQIRAAYKKPEYITIGFYGVDSNDYYFTRQLYADRDNLHDVLNIYKQWKNFILQNNCIVKTYTTESGQIIPGQAAKPITKTIEVKADIKKPLIIHLK